MSTDRVQISEELDGKLLATGIGFEDAHDGLSGSGDMPTNGIDPSSVSAAERSQQKTKDLLKNGKSATDKGRGFVRDGKDGDGASAKDIDSVDAEADKDLKDGHPATATSADSSGQGDHPNARNPLSALGGQGMPQMGMPSYNPASLPTPPMASQFDMNNAPNRDALRSAARDGMHDGSLPGSRAGRHHLDSGAARTEFQQRVLEAVDAAVNADPPIPYAWGGGHGATPGPTQGIHDGGWADQCGDYAKTGLDCSGFYRYVMAEATGQDIAAGTSEALWSAGTPTSSPQIGDAAFPASAGRPPQHIQIYVGDGMVAEAQKSGTYLTVSKMSPGTEFRSFVD